MNEESKKLKMAMEKLTYKILHQQKIMSEIEPREAEAKARY